MPVPHVLQFFEHVAEGRLVGVELCSTLIVVATIRLELLFVLLHNGFVLIYLL